MELSEHIEKKLMEETIVSLWKDCPTNGTFSNERMIGTRLKILVRRAVTDTKAEIHDQEGDLWYCLEGSTIFVVGGTLAQPSTYIAAAKTTLARGIEGGKTVVLNKGDWLYIPPKQPHQHTQPDKATLLIIKIPTMEAL